MNVPPEWAGSKERIMVIDATPRRQQPTETEIEQRKIDALVEEAERHATRGMTPPPAPPVLPAGPSWREFIFFQLSLLLTVALLFGVVAAGLIARAGRASGGTAAGVAPLASSAPAMSGMPLADPAHANMPAVAASANAPRLPQPKVAPPVGQREATTVKLELETQEVVATLDDGITYTYWTFGGTVPGPMIRVRQGDTVELTLKNSPTSQAAHNIDLHAVTGPGGGGEATMVAPGESKTFTFQAMNPGTFVYHCATAPVPHHIASGMYGMIVVEPPQGLPKVDREFYVMQGELYLEGQRADKGLRTFSMEKMLAEQPDYVFFNGAVGALTGENALKAKTGETVRIFFGVGGPNLTSSFHVIGEIFDRVAVEGASLEDPTRWATNVQSTGVPTGGATVVEFKVEVPGKYSLVDHSLGRALKGAAAVLLVEGPENPAVFSPQR
jgi:nitrite reductase (NO-forming)